MLSRETAKFEWRTGRRLDNDAVLRHGDNRSIADQERSAREVDPRPNWWQAVEFDICPA